MKEKVSYYHLPVWMSILIDGMIKAHLVCELKNRGENKKGLYQFSASYGGEESREETMFVWNATPEAIQKHLKVKLPTDVCLLVSMAEEYARDRNGREETKVYRGIIQLLVARAVELFNAEKPDETLNIKGDFSLIGRLPRNGKLRVIGKVERVERPVGESLEVAHKECPRRLFYGSASFSEGAWRIVEEEAPIGCVWGNY